MQTKLMIKLLRATIDKSAPGARAMLFGSRARGSARKDSDWDVFVLLDKERITMEDQDNVAYPLTQLGWDYNEVINPILFTEEYWRNHSFTPFHHNVTKEGIEI